MTQAGVRVAVLGAASFAEVAHIPGVNAHARASVTALYGSDLGRAREMASRCGVPDATDDLDALLARDDIDAVTIVTSDEKHYAYAMAALGAGKHVFLEKPMALNAEQAAEMTRAAREAGVVHQMSFTFRHNYALSELRRRVHAGDVGHVRFVEIQGQWSTRPERRVPPLPYQNEAYARMGYLGEMGSHYIDAVNFICGRDHGYIAELTSIVETLPREHASPDLATVLFRTAGGVPGQFIISRMTPAPAPYAAIHGDGVEGHLGYITVSGESGALSAGFSRGNAESLRVLGDGRTWERIEQGAAAYDGTPHSLAIMFGRFIDTILVGRDASGIAATFEDGYRSQAAIDAALKAAAARTWEAVAQEAPP